MNLFAEILLTLSSIGFLILSALRYRLELKRSKDIEWETAVRLMTSDPDSRIRSDDFAELYTALCFLRKNPGCCGNNIRLSEAIHNAEIGKQQIKSRNANHQVKKEIH